MDHPIVTDLRMARAKAWERLRMLVGQWAYLRKFPELLNDPLPNRLDPVNRIEEEIKELISLLAPGQTLEFSVYEPGAELDGLIYVMASETGFRDGRYKWIAAQMSNPIAQPIEQPGAADDLDDPLDQLLNLGD